MSKIYSRKSWTATSVFFQISVIEPWWFIEPPHGCYVSKCCTYCTRTSAQALNVHLFLHVHCPAMPAGEVKLQGAEWGVPVFLPEQSKWKRRRRVFSTIAKVQQGKASDLKWLAGHPETNQTCSPVGDTVSLSYLEPVWRRGKKKYYHQIREDEVPTQNEPLAFEDGG